MACSSSVPGFWRPCSWRATPDHGQRFAQVWRRAVPRSLTHFCTVRKGSVCTSPQEDLFFHSCWLQSRGVFGTKEGVSERPATVSQFVILPSTMTERLPRLNTNIMQSVEMSRQRTCSQESSMQAHFESTTETLAIAGISQICDRETLQQSVCSLFLGNLACILNPCFEKLRSDCRAWSN